MIFLVKSAILYLISPLVHNQDFFGFFVCGKLPDLKELVGTYGNKNLPQIHNHSQPATYSLGSEPKKQPKNNGFEPSTSWSRTLGVQKFKSCRVSHLRLGNHLKTLPQLLHWLHRFDEGPHVFRR